VTTNNPTLRSRVWNLLRTARGIGQAGIALATLATVLGATPEGVLASVMPEMMDGTIYCDPAGGDVTLSPRSFPEGV
jgi:hypothetical protein